MTRTFRIPAVIVLTLVFATAVFSVADDKAPTVSLKADSIDVATYTQLPVRATDNSRAGVIETFKPPSGVILSVDLSIAVPWSDTLQKLRVRSKEIMLVDADGKKITPVGKFRLGEFEFSTPSIYASRPFDWKKSKPDPVRLNAVFLVPADAKGLTFKIGDMLSAPVTVPAKTSTPPHPSDKAKIEVASARLVGTLATVVSSDGLPGTLTNPNGKILEVTFRLTPTASLGSYPTIYYWNTKWFTIVTDGKCHVPTVGEAFKNRLATAVSHNTRKTTDGTWQTETAKLYFAVPEGTRSFTLLCLMRPVGKGTVEE